MKSLSVFIFEFLESNLLLSRANFGIVYFGLTLAADDLGGEIYRDYILLSLFEVASIFLAIYVCSRYLYFSNHNPHYHILGVVTSTGNQNIQHSAYYHAIKLSSKSSPMIMPIRASSNQSKLQSKQTPITKNSNQNNLQSEQSPIRTISNQNNLQLE